MKILCCDTSNRTCCSGLYEDGKELSYEISFEKKTHSETFMPLVMRVCGKAGHDLSDTDAFAVTVGPGSFTGIRIGLAAVKGMALASGAGVIPVSSLKALALSVENVAADPSDTVLVPCFDARNDRVFAAAYSEETGEALVADNAYYNKDLVRCLEQIPDSSSKHFIIVGDGADVIRRVLFFTDRADYAPGAMILPQGIMRAADGVDPVNGASVTAAYCAATRAERYENDKQ